MIAHHISHCTNWNQTVNIWFVYIDIDKCQKYVNLYIFSMNYWSKREFIIHCVWRLLQCCTYICIAAIQTWFPYFLLYFFLLSFFLIVLVEINVCGDIFDFTNLYQFVFIIYFFFLITLVEWSSFRRTPKKKNSWHDIQLDIYLHYTTCATLSKYFVKNQTEVCRFIYFTSLVPHLPIFRMASLSHRDVNIFLLCCDSNTNIRRRKLLQADQRK